MCCQISIREKNETGVAWMLKRTGWICPGAFFRGTKGVALIEVVIAVVVLGMITASVPPVMVLIRDAEFRRNEQSVAESLTRNVMEYIKSAEYIDGNSTSPEPQYLSVEREKQLVPNESYQIEVIARPVHIDPVDPDHPHSYLAPGVDEGIQEITVMVYHVDKLVVETRNYKVDR